MTVPDCRPDSSAVPEPLCCTADEKGLRRAVAAAVAAGSLLSAAACGVEEKAVAAHEVASAPELDTPAPQVVQFLAPSTRARRVR